MKGMYLYLLLACLIFCFGCSTVFSGVDFPAFPTKKKEFNHLIGKKYEVLSPLVVGKFEKSWGGYILVSPNFNVKRIVDVPVKSIIVLDHISISPTTQMGKFYNYKDYHFIAYFKDKKIFSKKFDLEFLVIGSDDNLSLDPKYFKEIK